MLVISRTAGTTVRIGDAYTSTVVDIRGDKVRLAFVVPRTVPVHRQEIWESVRREMRGNQ